MEFNPSKLDIRGFGPLIPTTRILTLEPDLRGPDREHFSYFSYAIRLPRPRRLRPQRLFDETWTRIPLDGIWTFMRQYETGWANTCILHLCENADGQAGRVSEDLARHWCPALFDDSYES